MKRPFAVGIDAGDDAQIGTQQLDLSADLRNASRVAHQARNRSGHDSVDRSTALGQSARAKAAKWSLRIITVVGDLAASLAIFLQIEPARASGSESGSLLARDTYYSTTKGADCAISCFEIASFTLIVTLYFPGCESRQRQRLLHRQLIAVCTLNPLNPVVFQKPQCW